MAELLNSRYKKVLTVSGAFLILLPVGVSWFWGNISVYILSYILYATSLDHGLEAPWILSLMRITWTIGLLFGSHITYLTGKKQATIIIGVLIFNSGIFLSYFSIKISVVLTSICMGGIVGVGKGILEGTTLTFVMDWALKDAWFLKSFVLCAVPTGAIIISQFATLHVNPFNLSPDFEAGHMMFFSQKEVLENVPSMFLRLAVASMTVQFIGIFMLREMNRGQIAEEEERSKTYGAVHTTATNTTSIQKPSAKTEESDWSSSRGVEQDEYKTPKDSDNENGNMNTCRTCSLANEVLRKNNSDLLLNGYVPQDGQQDTGNDPSNMNDSDYNTLELLRSCAFYAITISYLCGDTSFIVFKNYYKSYGQQSIDNDHFLAEAVIVLCLISIFVKIIWIFIMDGIGHITCMIFQFALMTILTMSVYFSPLLNKWMYLFFYSVFNAVACSYDEVFTAISFKQFGQNIFSTRYRLVTAFTILVHLATAPILQALLNNLGWFSIFVYSASLNCAGMLLLTAFYLKSSKCWNPRHESEATISD